MNFEDAKLRLWNHAGLPGSGLPVGEDWHCALWNADRRRAAPEFEPFGREILTCLETVNTWLNGPVPSVRNRASQGTTAFASVAYSISCIIEEGLEYHRRWSREATFDRVTCDALEDWLHRIAYAWSQVLAGDVDELLEGFDHDGASRMRPEPDFWSGATGGGD